MNELDRIKQIAGLSEGVFDNKVSPVEHAKRIGMQGLQDAKTRFDVILEKSNDTDMLNLAADGMEACVEAMKTLRSIK